MNDIELRKWCLEFVNDRDDAVTEDYRISHNINDDWQDEAGNNVLITQLMLADYIYNWITKKEETLAQERRSLNLQIFSYKESVDATITGYEQLADDAPEKDLIFTITVPEYIALLRKISKLFKERTETGSPDLASEVDEKLYLAGPGWYKIAERLRKWMK